MANSIEKVRDFADKMLGHKLITKQTGEAGKPCNVVRLMAYLT